MMSSGPGPEAIPELAHGAALLAVREVVLGLAPVHVLSLVLAPLVVLLLGRGVIHEVGKAVVVQFSLGLPEVQKVY